LIISAILAEPDQAPKWTHLLLLPALVWPSSGSPAAAAGSRPPPLSPSAGANDLYISPAGASPLSTLASDPSLFYADPPGPGHGDKEGSQRRKVLFTGADQLQGRGQGQGQGQGDAVSPLSTGSVGGDGSVAYSQDDDHDGAVTPGAPGSDATVVAPPVASVSGGRGGGLVLMGGVYFMHLRFLVLFSAWHRVCALADFMSFAKITTEVRFPSQPF
jgi:hypothetical protein